jgi:hypothetical protein
MPQSSEYILLRVSRQLLIHHFVQVSSKPEKLERGFWQFCFSFDKLVVPGNGDIFEIEKFSEKIS